MCGWVFGPETAIYGENARDSEASRTARPGEKHESGRTIGARGSSAESLDRSGSSQFLWFTVASPRREKRRKSEQRFRCRTLHRSRSCAHRLPVLDNCCISLDNYNESLTGPWRGDFSRCSYLGFVPPRSMVVKYPRFLSADMLIQRDVGLVPIKLSDPHFRGILLLLLSPLKALWAPAVH